VTAVVSDGADRPVQSSTISRWLSTLDGRVLRYCSGRLVGRSSTAYTLRLPTRLSSAALYCNSPVARRRAVSPNPVADRFVRRAAVVKSDLWRTDIRTRRNSISSGEQSGYGVGQWRADSSGTAAGTDRSPGTFRPCPTCTSARARARSPSPITPRRRSARDPGDTPSLAAASSPTGKVLREITDWQPAVNINAAHAPAESLMFKFV